MKYIIVNERACLQDAKTNDAFEIDFAEEVEKAL